jgi:AraC-like DNA-binding protein
MPAAESLDPWIPPVYLYAAGRESISSTRYVHDASVPSPRRILIKRTISGTGTLYVGDKRHAVLRGWAFVIERPGPYRYCYEHTREPWKFEFVTIGFRDSTSVLPEWLRLDPLIAIHESAELDEQFRRLVELRLANSSRDDLLHSALAYRFFLGYVAARSRAATSRDRRPVALCRQKIERQFASPLSMRALAGEAGIEPETLSRNFRAQYGVTPRHYVNLLRIRQACRMLESGDLPLKTIALKCGFSSPHYFGRTFRQFLKMSPGAYRHKPDPLRAELGAHLRG